MCKISLVALKNLLYLLCLWNNYSQCNKLHYCVPLAWPKPLHYWTKQPPSLWYVLRVSTQTIENDSNTRVSICWASNYSKLFNKLLLVNRRSRETTRSRAAINHSILSRNRLRWRGHMLRSEHSPLRGTQLRSREWTNIPWTAIATDISTPSRLN